MPLFGHKEEPAPPQTKTTPTSTNRLSRNRSHRNSNGGLFSRRRTSSSSISASDIENARQNNVHTPKHTGGSSGGGLSNIFHRSQPTEDPSISAARERVVKAERARAEADAALRQAQVAVREAQAEVKRLEKEAEEEARLAKIKQSQAKDLSNRTKPLGRKYY